MGKVDCSLYYLSTLFSYLPGWVKAVIPQGATHLNETCYDYPPQYTETRLTSGK